MAMYTASFKDQVNATTAVDFFEVKAPSDHSVIIHGWSLSQSTEIKDTEEEQVIITTNRGTAGGGSITSGSGGAAATEVGVKRTDTTAGTAVETCNTTKMAVGTGTLTSDIEVHCWNIRVPFIMWYTPETRPVILPGDYWTLELDAAVTDAVKWSGTLWFEEV